MIVATTREELLDARLDLAEQRAGEVAAVLTMGALHDGHRSLVDAARQRVGDEGVVVLTIFVNPLQFAAGEDLARYPRDLTADLAVAADAGVDVVFAPDVDTIYPNGSPSVTVDPGPLGDQLEGAARPGHFRGVLTVVTKLLNLVIPAVTCFGEKDYQQLVLVRRACDELELGVEVVAVPTVRDVDGLALSSRNRYLTPSERTAALTLVRALRAGSVAAADGPDAALRAARAELADAGDQVDVDYCELRDPDLREAPHVGEGRLLVAGRVGGTRLIDTMAVQVGMPRSRG